MTLFLVSLSGSLTTTKTFCISSDIFVLGRDRYFKFGR